MLIKSSPAIILHLTQINYQKFMHYWYKHQYKKVSKSIIYFNPINKPYSTFNHLNSNTIKISILTNMSSSNLFTFSPLYNPIYLIIFNLTYIMISTIIFNLLSFRICSITLHPLCFTMLIIIPIKMFIQTPFMKCIINIRTI